MTITYTNTEEDIIAFNAYHCAHSPTIRRQRLVSTVVVPVLLFAFFCWDGSRRGDTSLVFGGLIAGGLVALFARVSFGWNLRRTVRKMMREGGASHLGERELSIAEDGLVETSESGQQRVNWPAVERIATNDDYAFIYISPVMAHVIPRHRTNGDLHGFLDAVRLKAEV